MASHFKWYPAESEVVVPFNARYSFPSQANKAIKMTPRIPPKNGGTFGPGNVIRLEFPAQGYINPGKTTFEFDVTLENTPAAGEFVRFQNNIQSIFSRGRILYGATPLEDIPEYNVMVRCVTEWTSTNQQGTYDATSIAEGIGGVAQGTSGRTTNIAASNGELVSTLVNVRQAYIHGSSNQSGSAVVPAGNGIVPNGTVTAAGTVYTTNSKINPKRRYQVQLAFGLLNQDKLIPTKFMASQLAIELTLANVKDCIIGGKTVVTAGTGVVSAPANTVSYSVTNVNMIPEILEFDASYDESFLRGLQSGGVPIKFATWNQFNFSTSAQNAFNLQIQERSRSVKAIFAMQRRANTVVETDSGACFYTSNTSKGVNPQTLQQYQYRIGGRYFPASPVQCSTDVGGDISNGGAEAWVELSKALNILGDYRLSASINTTRWNCVPGIQAGVAIPLSQTTNLLPDSDYSRSVVGYLAGGAPLIKYDTTDVSGAAGTLGSGMFAMAIDLETSNGLEISGLNAEEQSDISLIARYSDVQGNAIPTNVTVFTYIDSMIVLRENNVLELIQ